MTPAGPFDPVSSRHLMVTQQLRARDIRDDRVLEAMRAVPRERFVPEALRARAYEDAALPIGAGQTISQPYMVAAICPALQLRGGEVVLDVGTGSGYQAAVLAELADEVHTIERVPELAEGARRALAEAGYDRVHVHVGDGTLGVPEVRELRQLRNSTSADPASQSTTPLSKASTPASGESASHNIGS